MIFPSTSSCLLVDVVMLMRNCSDCSCRMRGFARFFHTPQIYTDTHTQISYGIVAVMMQLYLDIKPYSIDNFQKFSYKYIYTQITHVHLLNTLCDCTLIPRLQTFNIKPLLLPETGGKKCGSVPTSHNFQFRGNLHFN